MNLRVWSIMLCLETSIMRFYIWKYSMLLNNCDLADTSKSVRRGDYADTGGHNTPCNKEGRMGHRSRDFRR